MNRQYEGPDRRTHTLEVVDLESPSTLTSEELRDLKWFAKQLRVVRWAVVVLAAIGSSLGIPILISIFEKHWK